MALDPLNSRNLEQLALKGLDRILCTTYIINHLPSQLNWICLRFLLC